jgi:hypothetical protein
MCSSLKLTVCGIANLKGRPIDSFVPDVLIVAQMIYEATEEIPDSSPNSALSLTPRGSEAPFPRFAKYCAIDPTREEGLVRLFKGVLAASLASPNDRK